MGVLLISLFFVVPVLVWIDKNTPQERRFNTRMKNLTDQQNQVKIETGVQDVEYGTWEPEETSVGAQTNLVGLEYHYGTKLV
ncbi:hypothetical protein HNQ57_003559 [Zhongshania antarctica]|uniref:Uncharacterized protein n=2 Tax=Gammaproteobacteria TaxID=1236 RepID=A0A840R9W8_9GAMM|nr:hypothetical protein [Zhongshania antarctica]MBB5189256.1 hypothetical protein [Zhongshania antarctica]